MKCGELLYGRRFPLRLKGAVYANYVRPAILYESEEWCLKECEMGMNFMKGRKICGGSHVWSTAQKQ